MSGDGYDGPCRNEVSVHVCAAVRHDSGVVIRRFQAESLVDHSIEERQCRELVHLHGCHRVRERGEEFFSETMVVLLMREQEEYGERYCY